MTTDGCENWTCYRLWINGECVDTQCVPPGASDVARVAILSRQSALSDDAEDRHLSWLATTDDPAKTPERAYLQLGADDGALIGSVELPYQAVMRLLIEHGHFGADQAARFAELPDGRDGPVIRRPPVNTAEGPLDALLRFTGENNAALKLLTDYVHDNLGTLIDMRQTYARHYKLHSWWMAAISAWVLMVSVMLIVGSLR